MCPPQDAPAAGGVRDEESAECLEQLLDAEGHHAGDGDDQGRDDARDEVLGLLHGHEAEIETVRVVGPDQAPHDVHEAASDEQAVPQSPQALEAGF